ncbi:MAG: sulfatase-like hydrolase/transferase [Limisphaerales bacterium]
MKRIVLFLLCALPLAAADLPNILWITSEDHGPEMGCYGDQLARTPNVDALAAKGMRFKLAWSCAPVCAPARTTIITGLYPPSCGGQHMRSMVSLPGFVQFYPRYLREAGYYTSNNSKQDYNVKKEDKGWNESSNRAHYQNRQPGQPFFAIFNSGVSHESKIRRRPHEAVTDLAKVRVPAYHPDNAESRQDWAQYYDIVSQADEIAGKHLGELDQSGLRDNTIVFYYGDHGSGMSRGKRWPYNSGLHVPMVVYFPDKWKHLAPKEYQAGGASDRMVSFVDLAPTVLSIAGIKPPIWMQGHAFAGKHQQAAPKYMFGFRDRMDERYDFIRTVTDGRYQYIRNFNPHFIYGQHVAYNFVTPSTAAWKRDFDAGKLNAAQSVFWKLKPAEELYDLHADPDEVNNLANSPKHLAKLKELRGALYDWCREIRDVGFLPEGEIHSRSEGTTPFEMARNREKYPFHKIFAAADLATRRTKNALPKLREYLLDTDSAVRYWGAIGILNRGQPAVREMRRALLGALNDDSPYVQVAASYALAKHGDEAGVRFGLEELLELSQWKDGRPVFPPMAALNAIDKLDSKAAKHVDAIKTFPNSLGAGGTSPDARYNGYVHNLLSKTLTDLGAKPPVKPKRKKK